MSLKEDRIKFNSYVDGVNKSLIVTFLNCFRTVSNVAISSAPVGEEYNSSCSEVISVDESMQCNELYVVTEQMSKCLKVTTVQARHQLHHCPQLHPNNEEQS